MSLRWSLKSLWDGYYKHAAPTELTAAFGPFPQLQRSGMFIEKRREGFKLRRSDIAPS